jgi:hypothetical protein
MSLESTAAPKLTVTFVLAGIVDGSDVDKAEVYFEGWVDDGAERTTFRIPREGHIPEIADGQTITVDTAIYEGRPEGDTLTVHFEAWDEDLGKASRLDADDCLGIYERRFTRAERFGQGRYDGIPCKSDKGEWLLSFRIDAR